MINAMSHVTFPSAFAPLVAPPATAPKMPPTMGILDEFFVAVLALVAPTLKAATPTRAASAASITLIPRL